MPGRYPHLKDATARLADADDATRIRAIKGGVWVTYGRAKEVLERMEALFDHPPIDRMPHMLLVGESNNGKTQILRRFQARHPSDPNPRGETSIIPVVFVSAPPTPDVGELCTRILDAVDAPYRDAAKASERLRVAKLVLGQIGTRMLLVDEIQHMLTGGATKQREFRNAIKDLGNELKISIVAAGIDTARTVFATDPQLSNRFQEEWLPPWSIGTDLGRLLDSIELQLPLRKPSGLKSPELLQRVSFASGGTIGGIYAVLTKAAEAAIRGGAEQITLSLLDSLSRGRRVTQSDRASCE